MAAYASGTIRYLLSNVRDEFGLVREYNNILYIF